MSKYRQVDPLEFHFIQIPLPTTPIKMDVAGEHKSAAAFMEIIVALLSMSQLQLRNLVRSHGVSVSGMEEKRNIGRVASGDRLCQRMVKKVAIIGS